MLNGERGSDKYCQKLWIDQGRQRLKKGEKRSSLDLVKEGFWRPRKNSFGKVKQ